MRTRNRLLFMALLGLWVGIVNQGVVAARVRNNNICGDACPSGQSCGYVCYLTEVDFENGGPSTTCGDEGYSCCGDGVCNPSTEGCNVCTSDCGEVASCYSGCASDADCASGLVCNSAQECVNPAPYTSGAHTPACGGACTSDSQCCGMDLCMGAAGVKYCAIPEHTYCPDAPACSGSGYSNCSFSTTCGGSYYDGFCDPGINRCMFNDGFDCATSVDDFCA